jgi:hypothetical protein
MDQQKGQQSLADKGKHNRQIKVKFYSKQTTGDLGGDYKVSPPEPQVNGWHKGNENDWSLNLPWTDDPSAVKPWWDHASDNGEKEYDVDIKATWEIDSLAHSVISSSLDVIPTDMFTP